MLEYEVLKRLRAGALHEFTQDLRIVLVDEYQDTNLLQEQIYFEMAKACGGALGVVGDDDQSLYRFRGATVNLFRDFASRYGDVYGKAPLPVYLSANYRSTKSIVEFVNQFAELDPAYQAVRVAGKPRLTAGPNARDGLPVLAMFRDTVEDLASDLADFVHAVFRRSGYKISPTSIVKADPVRGDVGDCALLCSSPADYSSSGNARLPLLLKDRTGGHLRRFAGGVH